MEPMELKRVLDLTVWIVVGSVLALLVLGALMRYLNMALELVVLMVPALAALFPADRYRKKNIYLPLSERALVSFLSMGILGVFFYCVTLFAETKPIGPWLVYAAVLLLEGAAIFAMLSLMTFKQQERT
jgi:putative flippase GtrA